MKGRSRMRLAIGIAALAGVATAFASVRAGVPSFSNGTYSVGGADPVPFSMPLATSTGEDETIVASFTMDVPRGISTLRFVPDDCVEEMAVNGRNVDDPAIPFCDYAKGRAIDLAGYLRDGSNDVRITIKNAGGPAALSVKAAGGDPKDIARLALLAVCLSACAVAAFRGMTGAKSWRAIDAAVVAAVLARVAYFAQTSPTIRGYDVDGHIEYIEHVLGHWSVPAIADGWQFYQPPLYYLLVALPAAAIGGGRELATDIAQLSSLCLSTASVVLAAWIATLFFPKPSQRPLALATFATWAFVPATLFFAGRVNNDVLLEPLGLAAFGMLCAWWLGKREAWWHGAVVAFSLALLTKSNALLLAPVFAACLSLKPGVTVKARVRLGAAAAAIVVVACGWYAGLRAIEGQDRIVANLGNLNGALRLETRWTNMAEFNPVRVAAQPYNDPWNDAKGRQSFWEYLFRSAFTGEFQFGDSLAPLASAAIALGVAVFALALLGAWHVVLQRPLELLPLWLTPLTLLLGHAAYRQFVAPFSSSQDFRYSILALLPLSILAVQGFAYVPFAGTRWPRIVAWSFAVTCALFACSVGAA